MMTGGQYRDSLKDGRATYFDDAKRKALQLAGLDQS